MEVSFSLETLKNELDHPAISLHSGWHSLNQLSLAKTDKFPVLCRANAQRPTHFILLFSGLLAHCSVWEEAGLAGDMETPQEPQCQW